MQHFGVLGGPPLPVNSDYIVPVPGLLDGSTAKHKNGKKDDQCIFSAKMHARAQLPLVG